MSRSNLAGMLTGTIRDLSRQGITERDIAMRTGLGKSTVHDICSGRYGLSEKRALQVQEVWAPQVQAGGYYATIPNRRGQMVNIEGISEYQRNRILAYKIEVGKFLAGKSNNLAHFRGQSVTIRGPNGPERFKLVTNRKSLKAMATAGQLDRMNVQSPRPSNKKG